MFFRSARTILVIIGMCIGGVIMLTEGISPHNRYKYQQKHFSAPKTMTMSEFVQAHPKQGWVRITMFVPVSDLSRIEADELSPVVIRSHDGQVEELLKKG